MKRVLRNCLLCKKRRARSEMQVMADLSADRALLRTPFTKVGVDYFGPMIIKRAVQTTRDTDVCSPV